MVKIRQKNLLKIDSKIRIKIEKIIEKIYKKDLDGLNIKALLWNKNLFRCRVGKIRIIFSIEWWKMKLKKLGFRWDVYKK